MRMTDRDLARETIEEDQDTKKQEHRQLFLKGQEKDPAHQLHGKSIRQPFKHVIHLSSPPSVYIVFSRTKKLSFLPNKNARHMYICVVRFYLEIQGQPVGRITL